jgi:hypothetical protein
MAGTLNYWDGTQWVVVQGPAGPAGLATAPASGDLSGNYPSPTVKNLTALRGYNVDPASPGGGSIIQLVAYNGVGSWVWAPVSLGGDIVWTLQPTGPNTVAGYQVRGLYGVPITGPLSTGQGYRYSGGSLAPSAFAGNISNNALYMNNPSTNWAAPSGFSVIGNMYGAPLALTAGLIYLLIGNVTVQGPQAALIEIGFGSASAFGVSGWACNAYFHLPQPNYNVTATCWAFVSAGAAAQNLYLCIQTNTTGVTVIRNGVNYCTAALATALSYGNA